MSESNGSKAPLNPKEVPAKAQPEAAKPVVTSRTNRPSAGQKQRHDQVITEKKPPRKGKLLCDSRAGEVANAAAVLRRLSKALHQQMTGLRSTIRGGLA